MDEKSGTIALFRFGLIAPMVLERSLPARELTRRAREIAARDYDIRLRAIPHFPMLKENNVRKGLVVMINTFCCVTPFPTI
jgi:hypothetical protein